MEASAQLREHLSSEEVLDEACRSPGQRGRAPQKIAGVPTHSIRNMRLPELAIWNEWR
jgi:hypothetical protein